MKVIEKELLELSNVLVSYIDLRILGEDKIPNLFNMDKRLEFFEGTDINKHLNELNSEDWRLLSYNVLMMREKLKSFVLIYSPALTSNKDLYSRLLAVYRSFSKFDDWFGITFTCIDQREGESFKRLVEPLSENIKTYLSDVRALRKVL